jgi:hypothetical protein
MAAASGDELRASAVTARLRLRPPPDAPHLGRELP